MIKGHIHPPITIVRTIYFVLIFILSLIQSVLAAQTSFASNQADQKAESGLVTSPSAVRSLRLATCFEKADIANKDLIVAGKNISIAKAGIKIASAIPNPLIEVQTGFGPSFNKLYTGQTQQVFFTEQIQTAGKRSKKINLAQSFTELTKLQLTALRFDVHNRVRRAYAELVAAEAYENLIEAERQVALQLSTIAQKRFDTGKIPKSELLQADLNVLQFDTQRNQAQGRLQQASAALSLVIGEKPEHVEVIDVTDNGLFKLSTEKTEIVPMPNQLLCPLEKLLLLAYASRPDYKTAQQQIFVNRKAFILAKAQRIPDLFIGAGFTFSTFSRHQPTGLVAQPNWLGQGAFLNVSAETPAFYQHQGEIQQTLANLRNSEKQADLLKAQIATSTVLAYNLVKSTTKNIFIFQNKLLPASAQLAQIARKGYQTGDTDLTVAILAQQQYQQTLSNYFDAVVAYQNAWADLEKAVGCQLYY